jgi:hypothetical protein
LFPTEHCGQIPVSWRDFPSEIVRCGCDDGGELGLFCKYGIGHTTSGDGHRGGVRREAAVYRRFSGAPANRRLDGERAYADARWSDGDPPSFSKTLDSARLYVQFRWLGDPLTQRKQRWRFRELHLTAERLGLI